MIYPEFLKIGDTIGVCAPSDGIKERKMPRVEFACKQLESLGYKIKKSENAFALSSRGRSATAKIRAKEFMELYEDEEVKLIIFVNGGDFMCEMLDFIDFEYLKNLKPKWIQGYSDGTTLDFLFPSILDIASMYHQSFGDFGMKPWHKSLENCFEILSGKQIEQKSFNKCESVWDFSKPSEEEYNPYAGYDLVEDVEWHNICGKDEINIEGRVIGGCLDVIKMFFGTKYDKISEFISKYKNDGIIWFFDCFELGSASIFTTLWQMKNAGFFENCKGVVFGRPLFAREDYGISFNESVKDILEDLNIPVISDCDIGHRSPQFPIVNGSIAKIVSKNGKGTLENIFE